MKILQLRKEKSVYPPVIVSVCGLKHTGKSSVGRLLSGLFKADFFDTDEMLLRAVSAEKASNLPGDLHAGELNSMPQKEAVRMIYTQLGDDAFHEYELACTQQVFHRCRKFSRSAVIAFGGGISDSRKLMDFTAAGSILLHLQVPEHILFRRISSGGIPPFLDSVHPEDSFHVLYERRRRVYRKFADIEFIHADESLDEIMRFLENNGLKQMIEEYYARK